MSTVARIDRNGSAVGAADVPTFVERELLALLLAEPMPTAERIAQRWPAHPALVPGTDSLRHVVEAATDLRAEGAHLTPAILMLEVERRGHAEDVRAVIRETHAAATGATLYALDEMLDAVLESFQRRHVARASEALGRVARDPDAAVEDVLAAADRVARLRAEISPKSAGAGDVDAIRARTAGELLAEADAEVEEFFWPGVVAPGLVTLIAAAAKCGKSWILSAFVAALSAGRPWLGADSRAPVGVLYVTEEGPRTVKRRIRRFGIGDGVRFVTVADLPPEWAWRRKADALLLLAVAVGARVVVVDTVLNLADLPPDAANDDGAVRAALAPLVRGAAVHDLAVVIVHHARKAGGDGGAAIFGANAFRSVPDILVELGHQGGEDAPERKLRVRGRLEEGAGTFVVRHVEGADGPDGYQLVGSPAEDRKRKAEAAILATLNEADGWLATGAVRRRVGAIRKADFLEALKGLTRGDRIQAREHGRGFAFARLGMSPDAPTYSTDADEAASDTGGDS